ncbi:PREDICTED: GDSL esterase/lipase At5g08460-like [Lupinus angustifolius]|uniref:GDSL esterase/lipase At5g08460-like n=1 Tax=Lupinus angustifolius TaxID=3871 RepID=UPI00092E8C1C|nr:PREDICTED: GDSL esterase/lipase At5g08460-like [Lupinus angustifolius]
MAHLLVVTLLTMFLISFSANDVVGESLFPAMFVFGDSLVDAGNNNFLNSLAKANFEPYGIDFSAGPTGRFCNGKTPIDILGERVGLPYLPAFADTVEPSDNIFSGVNYASAAAGILDETGRTLGERISFSQQVRNFETTLSQLNDQMENRSLSEYLAKSLAVLNHGSNDYINNYLLPELYGTSYIYNPSSYAEVLVRIYKNRLMDLHGLGLRKFLLAGIGPLGCIPNQLSRRLVQPGQCAAYVNNLVSMFNVALKTMVDQMNAEYNDSIFVYVNAYEIIADVIDNPNPYGFSVTDRACCGLGRNQGQLSCLPMSIPCTDRTEYVFWDAFHPTEAVNNILVSKAFTGPPSICYPINVKQMAEM